MYPASLVTSELFAVGYVDGANGGETPITPDVTEALKDFYTSTNCGPWTRDRAILGEVPHVIAIFD